MIDTKNLARSFRFWFRLNRNGSLAGAIAFARGTLGVTPFGLCF